MPSYLNLGSMNHLQDSRGGRSALLVPVSSSRDGFVSEPEGRDDGPLALDPIDLAIAFQDIERLSNYCAANAQHGRKFSFRRQQVPRAPTLTLQFALEYFLQLVVQRHWTRPVNLILGPVIAGFPALCHLEK